MNQGLNDSQLEKEMQKWNLNHEEVLKVRSNKKYKTDAGNIENKKTTTSAEEEE